MIYSAGYLDNTFSVVGLSGVISSYVSKELVYYLVEYFETKPRAYRFETKERAYRFETKPRVYRFETKE